MPGQGKAVERSYTEEELAAFAEGVRTLSLTEEQVIYLLGDDTFDVWLNRELCWTNIPANVWRYKLGGYQVIKKWLSYREIDVLGRPFKAQQEVGYVQEMARRIAAVLLMGPELDCNYAAVKVDTYLWPRAVKPERPTKSSDKDMDLQFGTADS
jgi:hypothetical protein